MIGNLEPEDKDITEYYLYSFYHDIGKNSSDAELMMVEYLDVIQMFEESTMKQIKECEKMGKSIREYFPIDGKCVEDNLFHHTIINCTDII